MCVCKCVSWSRDGAEGISTNKLFFSLFSFFSQLHIPRLTKFWTNRFLTANFSWLTRIAAPKSKPSPRGYSANLARCVHLGTFDSGTLTLIHTFKFVIHKPLVPVGLPTRSNAPVDTEQIKGGVSCWLFIMGLLLSCWEVSGVRAGTVWIGPGPQRLMQQKQLDSAAFTVCSWATPVNACFIIVHFNNKAFQSASHEIYCTFVWHLLHFCPSWERDPSHVALSEVSTFFLPC